MSEAQWSRIAPMLPGKATDPGRTAADNRLFINGVLWVLRSGARWSDLPERHGKYKSVHKRFTPNRGLVQFNLEDHEAFRAEADHRSNLPSQPYTSEASSDIAKASHGYGCSSDDP